MKASAKHLNVTPQDMVKLAVPEYFGVDIEYFSYIPRRVTDIYAKVDNKYELVLEKYIDIDEAELKASKLSIKEKEHVSKHVQIAAEIVQKYP